MSSIELPKFVLGIFQKEINDIKLKLIKKIAKDYYLDEEELIKNYICNIELINKNLENIQIVKKNNYNSKLKSGNRCLARVYNSGKGSQCKRSRNKNDLCTLHSSILENEGKLKYGYINKPRPKGVFLNKDPKKEKIY
jgi:hypothetical protein